MESLEGSSSSKLVPARKAVMDSTGWTELEAEEEHSFQTEAQCTVSKEQDDDNEETKRGRGSLEAKSWVLAVCQAYSSHLPCPSLSLCLAHTGFGSSRGLSFILLRWELVLLSGWDYYSWLYITKTCSHFWSPDNYPLPGIIPTLQNLFFSDHPASSLPDNHHCLYYIIICIVYFSQFHT